MLSDEEKIAFNYYKGCNEKDLENYEYLHEVSKKQVKYLEILLNLIEKQSKEIEELKENNKLLQENYSSAHEDINWFCENYISKEVSEQRERKAYIKGTNDADKLCNKKWEDKIKAKIEEIENTGIDVAWEQVNYTIREQDRAKIEVLQSLLEKE